MVGAREAVLCNVIMTSRSDPVRAVLECYVEDRLVLWLPLGMSVVVVKGCGRLMMCCYWRGRCLW